MIRNQKTPYEIAAFLKATNFGAVLDKSPQSIWAALVHTAKHALQIQADASEPLHSIEKNLKGVRFFRNLNIVKLAFRCLHVEYTIMEVLLSRDKAEKTILRLIRFGRFQTQVSEALAPAIKKLKDKENQLSLLKTKTQAQQKSLDHLANLKKEESQKYNEAVAQISHISEDTERKKLVTSNLDSARSELAKEILQLDHSQNTLTLQARSLEEEVKLLQGQIYENTSELRALLQQKESEFQSKSNRLLSNSEKEEQQYKSNLQIVESCLREIRDCHHAAEAASSRMSSLQDRRADLLSMQHELQCAKQEAAQTRSDIESYRSRSQNLQKEKQAFLARMRSQIAEEDGHTLLLQEEIQKMTQSANILQVKKGEARGLLEKGGNSLSKQCEEFKAVKERIERECKEAMIQTRVFYERMKESVNEAFS